MPIPAEKNASQMIPTSTRLDGKAAFHSGTLGSHSNPGDALKPVSTGITHPAATEAGLHASACPPLLPRPATKEWGEVKGEGEGFRSAETLHKPSVSIIIPCRNERDHIEHCLASTLRQMEPEGGFEVIVADGASDDGTGEILQNLLKKEARVRCIENPNRFASAGLNAAILAARAPIILRMDAHTEYAPDYVRQCLAVLQATGADNVGGPARTRADTYVQKAVAAAYHS